MWTLYHMHRLAEALLRDFGRTNFQQASFVVVVVTTTTYQHQHHGQCHHIVDIILTIFVTEILIGARTVTIMTVILIAILSRSSHLQRPDHSSRM